MLCMCLCHYQSNSPNQLVKGSTQNAHHLQPLYRQVLLLWQLLAWNRQVHKEVNAPTFPLYALSLTHMDLCHPLACCHLKTLAASYGLFDWLHRLHKGNRLPQTFTAMLSVLCLRIDSSTFTMTTSSSICACVKKEYIFPNVWSTPFPSHIHFCVLVK